MLGLEPVQSDEPAQVYVVEQGRRLSESKLWTLQRDLYNVQGIQAWSTGSVPQWITTSPIIARAYAQIALGYLRDLAAQIDPSQPIYFVELGAGSGRFAYRFIKRFTKVLRQSSLSHLSFNYVMTDITPNLIDFWQSHPSLQPLVHDGLVDFALFDATHPGDIQLINAQSTLQAGTVANPMIVIANYFFDSVPHDCFAIIDKQLCENLVKVTSPTAEPKLSGDQPLASLTVGFEPKPAPADYYDDPALNRVLEGYRQRLDDMLLLFPVSAMTCIRHFQHMSADRALFIIGDIGSTREEDIVEHVSGGVGNDSNFWLEVNFDAIGEYVRELGGQFIHPPYRHGGLNISAFMLGASQSKSDKGFPDTHLAFDDGVAQYGPDDSFFITRRVGKDCESMSRGELLTFLRSTGWDSDHVIRCMPLLLNSLQGASWVGREDLRRAIDEIWDAYFPIGETSEMDDLAFGLGVLLYTIGDFDPALEFFQRSLVIAGVDPRTTLNVALCLNRLERSAETLEWLDRTLELDPINEQAQELRRSLLATPRPE